MKPGTKRILIVVAIVSAWWFGFFVGFVGGYEANQVDAQHVEAK